MLAVFRGTPDWIRTSGLQSRSLSLYPAELRAHMERRGDLSPLRLIYYTIFFGNVKKKTAQKTKKIVKKVDKF